ncbi:type IV secretory pathway VirB10-like protein [Azospirillum fermentarium]|uniref:hypothetical protein n=1 Tax=Azospirillum fermentarium TaxID=1233114 RepID=UPI0022260D00|nr:hypothetical protein [Azospirillum fermentarium]MCW2247751.1 type IV secretory pathway VirB10-like protein [Azospirillum fermentarium]
MENQLRKKAMEAGVGGWSRKEEGASVASAQAGASDFTITGSDCLVLAGTPIPLLTVNHVVTERGGIVTARVTQDVWDVGFSCLAVPAGSVVMLDVGATVTNRSGYDGPRRCGPSGESHGAVLRESPHESYSAGLGIRCMAAR